MITSAISFCTADLWFSPVHIDLSSYAYWKWKDNDGYGMQKYQIYVYDMLAETQQHAFKIKYDPLL